MYTDLIRDLEAATEGSRELSDRVLLACGWAVHKASELTPTWFVDPTGKRHIHSLSQGLRVGTLTDPTRSLDDALALVPEDDEHANWRQIIQSAFIIMQTVWAEPYTLKLFILAVCIAVLKAQEQNR